ncbi:F-box only protein 15 isoform X2 [Esox lucius]|uniref:F-box domain-containing protein n=1 Tax=Esox lucius TaxID=8010 RepID=A0A3P8ZC56_ESOLU|nr:F-box only protein 15 isoform X2 [Esox lucius]
MATGSRRQSSRLATNAKQVPLPQKNATTLSQPTDKLTSQVSKKSARHAERAKPAGYTRKTHITRVPSEILLKILGYLDASSLYSMGYVNKLFYQLANNNGMWRQIYSAKYGEGKKWKDKPETTDELVEKLRAMDFKDRPEGYWRGLYFRTIAGHNQTKWKKMLRAINPYTGLPSHTERVLRQQCVSWEITVVDQSGCEWTFEQSHAYFSDSSVTIFWSRGSWPSFGQLSTLLLHGVKNVPLRCSKTIKPGWRSLMAQLEIDSIFKSCQVIDGDKKTSKSSQDIGGDNSIPISSQLIGQDGLVNLLLLSHGITIGIWRRQASIAFVMATFNYHMLVEKSLLGSSACPYSIPEHAAPFDDVDPIYGLHGYRLHITLHNTVTEIMSGHFSQLISQKSQIREGFIQLSVISRSSQSQHAPLSGMVSLPWRSDVLEGSMENCCVMSLTLLDESQEPFWCVSTPVSMVVANEETVSYDYQGQHFLITYQDVEGKVQMDVVWLEEPGQFFLINLVVYISTAKLRQHFGRTY